MELSFEISHKQRKIRIWQQIRQSASKEGNNLQFTKNKESVWPKKEERIKGKKENDKWLSGWQRQRWRMNK